MDDLIAALVAERFGPADRTATEAGTPEVIRTRQRVLAEMPGDEHPSEIKDDERE